MPTMSTAVTTGSVRRPTFTPAAQRARADRWFFSGTALLQVVLIVWGFAPTYFLRSASDLPPLATLLQVHGALFSAWLVLLLVQVSLVAARRTPLHRRLGTAGGALAVSMFVVGWLAAVDAARRGSTIQSFTPQAFLIIPILGIVGFAVLVGAALLWRARPDYHKRLMMLATAGGLSGAGIARIPVLAPLGPVAFLGIPDLFAVALMVYDWVTLRRIHPATAFGTIFILVLEGLQLTAANSGPWLAFAHWLTA
jgi:hypothetical protein